MRASDATPIACEFVGVFTQEQVRAGPTNTITCTMPSSLYQEHELCCDMGVYKPCGVCHDRKARDKSVCKSTDFRNGLFIQ